MIKICTFVPETHLDLVKSALFDAGAGKIGNYDHCCWQTLGTGQFRPLAGSDPFVGTSGSVEQVAEYKLELVCEQEKLAAAISALRKAHPYEEPAIDIIQLLDV